jgi:hypothetical protein
MRSIPSAIADDAEDVVWALETAEALWNRQERVDAIVWLRRAAQAAGDAQQDDRALELARNAAELSEWMAQNLAGPSASRPPATDAPAAGEDVDDLLGDPSEDVTETGEDVSEIEEADVGVHEEHPDPSAQAHGHGQGQGQAQGSPDADAGVRVSMSVPDEEPTPAQPRAVPATPRPPASPLPPPRAHVPTAAEVHAGMLDPWADAEAPTRDQPQPTVPPTPAPAAESFDSDEVVTSAPPFSVSDLENNAATPLVAIVPPPVVPAPATTPQAGQPLVASPPQGAQPRAPQPPRAGPPPRPGAPRPPVAPSRPKVAAAPAVRAPGVRAPTAPPARAPAAELTPTPAPVHAPGLTPTPVIVRAPEPFPPPAAPPASNGVDLSAVEALSDLPDDAREAFANAAAVQTLRREDEIAGFALALVLEGSVDLSATIVDAPAERLRAGAVLRSRGTIDTIAPIRLVGASETSRVATWGEDAVTDAFRTCPWVEDELRASGDRLQALVGITMGPLGDRLDPSLRADVTSRLRVRALAEHEIIATRGAPVPGLLVVGGGELELLGDDGKPNGTVIRAGEFLFPGETLSAARAPSTARASRGGAIILLAERGVAQELLVTCPPLLEIFAGM